MKREFKKIENDISFTSGKNVQQILCQENKPKLLSNSEPRVYQSASAMGNILANRKRKCLYDA